MTPIRPILPANPTRGFKLSSKLKSVLPNQRLKFLQKSASGGISVSFKTLRIMRGGFDHNKFKHLPIGTHTKCYCCGLPAEIRHHVHPLSQGGTNHRWNIVPLCNACHYKVHPDMGNRKARKEKEAIGPGALSSKNDIVAVTALRPSRGAATS